MEKLTIHNTNYLHKRDVENASRGRVKVDAYLFYMNREYNWMIPHPYDKSNCKFLRGYYKKGGFLKRVTYYIHKSVLPKVSI